MRANTVSVPQPSRQKSRLAHSAAQKKKSLALGCLLIGSIVGIGFIILTTLVIGEVLYVNAAGAIIMATMVIIAAISFILSHTYYKEVERIEAGLQ